MLGRGVGVGSVALLAILILVLLFGERADDPGDVADQGGRAADRSTVAAKVLRVVDGDTIEVEIDGSSEDVRYIGVDTPETVKPGTPVQCYGPEASERNEELVGGRMVRLEFDRELRDVYGRMLAYVFVGERLVNAELIEAGYARTLAIEPNTSRADQLERLEAEAGTAGRGIWGSC